MTHWIVVLCAAACARAVAAGPLLQAYEDALRADPSFEAARAARASAREVEPIARSALLPSASVSLSDTRVVGSRRIEGSSGVDARALDYRSPQAALNVRVPIFNLEANRRLRYAQEQVRYAEAVFATSRADLLDRTATAFLQSLTSQGRWAVARVDVEASRVQRDQVRERLQIGDGTQPELADAEAALAMAYATLEEARGQVSVARLALRQLTGREVAAWETELADIDSRLVDAPDTPALLDLPRLLDAAYADSPSIGVRQCAVDMARAALARQDVAQFPKAEVVLSAATSRNDSVSTLNQTIRQNALGVQINLPIDVGGGITAATRQALAELDKAEAELAAERLSVARELTRLHGIVSASAAKHHFHRSAIAAAKMNLDSARKGAIRGMATSAEVRSAEQRLAKARLAALEWREELALARLRLLIRIGTPPDVIASALDDDWTRRNAPAP